MKLKDFFDTLCSDVEVILKEQIGEGTSSVIKTLIVFDLTQYSGVESYTCLDDELLDRTILRFYINGQKSISVILTPTE